MSNKSLKSAEDPCQGGLCTWKWCIIQGDEKGWKLINKTCQNSRTCPSYCWSPDASKIRKDGDIEENECLYPGNTDDLLQSLNHGVRFSVPDIVQDENDPRYHITNGKWSSSGTRLDGTLIEVAGWQIRASLTNSGQGLYTEIILPQLQPKQDTDLTDIAAPILIEYLSPGTNCTSNSRFYWLMTFNQNLIEGRAYAILILDKLLLVVSRPVLSSPI